MARNLPTTKRVQIDKANLVIVIAVSAAAFVTVFSLVAVKSLASQRSYQAKVITAREKARDQLHENLAAADELTNSYKQFVSSTVNAIGGNPVGNGERDGDNARIVLDALPSKYDFPALATSLEKLTNGQGMAIENIEGIDDEVNQLSSSATGSPQPVEIPFKLGVKGGYASAQNLIGVLERSIRPFVVNEITLNANDSGNVTVTIDGKTYYQPEKGLQLEKEVIK